MSDHIARFVSDANCALSLVRCSDTAQLICHGQHQLAGAPQRVLGEAITSALLLGTRLKGPGLISYTIDTDGLLGSFRVDAIGLGSVRALVGETAVERVRDWNGFDPLVGSGTMTVTKRLADHVQPYQSILEVGDREGLPQLSNRYLRESEQVTAVMGLDVGHADGADELQAAGWYLELLPGADRDELPPAVRRLLEEPLSGPPLPPGDDEALVDEIFGPGCFRHLQSYAVQFACPCSRERYIQTLRGFGQEQLRSLTNGEGVIETTCDFCKAQYAIPLDEVI